MSNKNWILILNPKAGGGKGKRDKHLIEKLLKLNGFQFETLVSEYSKHAISLSKNAIENGATQIIIAGGDGTLNEVINGVFLQQVCAPEKILIGIIPVGSGNDWSKTFHIPNNYKIAIDTLKERTTILQDIGLVQFTNEGMENIRYFLNMAGFGFDAQVAFKANQLKDKGRRGLMVYLYSLISALRNYKTGKVQISLDDNNIEDLIFSISIGIGKFNGGGMMQAPNAIPNNGLFEVTIIKKINLWGILTNLVGLYNGNYVKDKRVDCYQAKEIRISAINPLGGEIDGESLGKSDFYIKILSQKLKVIIGDYR